MKTYNITKNITNKSVPQLFLLEVNQTLFLSDRDLVSHTLILLSFNQLQIRTLDPMSYLPLECW